MYFETPLGIKFLNCFSFKRLSFISKREKYKYSILILTYITYCLYHLSRRPFTVVRSVLTPNCSTLVPPDNIIINNDNINTWCAWKPFNIKNPNYLFGLLDSCYLLSYAFFMFFSGYVAERVHLRYFLSFGMIFCGIFTYLFGIAYYYNIHNIYYFVLIQIINGAFQTSGWPAVVTIVGNWCPKSSRGSIFGVWNTHTNLGNMLGALIGGLYVEYNWGLSFIFPGFIIGIYGFIIFLFLVPYPQEVGLEPLTSTKFKDNDRKNSDSNENYNSDDRINSSNLNEESSNVIMRKNENEIDISEKHPLIVHKVHLISNDKAISFYGALMIPHVMHFSLCLFFCKLVNYVILYWLPTFIKQTTSYNSKESALLSMGFDVGGIFGSIIIGVLFDYSGTSGIYCLLCFILTLPTGALFISFKNTSLFVNLVLQIILGCLLNAPYSLITTSVAANLSNKVQNKKALATISAIIDGVGSIGAAIGPLLAGYVLGYSWNLVYFTIFISIVLSSLMLYKIIYNEFKQLFNSFS